MYRNRAGRNEFLRGRSCLLQIPFILETKNKIIAAGSWRNSYDILLLNFTLVIEYMFCVILFLNFIMGIKGVFNPILFKI